MATFQNFKLSATSPHQNTGYYSISGANGSTYVSGQGKIIKSLMAETRGMNYLILQVTSLQSMEWL